MLVVDDRVAFCGGMNIAKEYCGTALGGTAFFRDTLVRVEGPAVQGTHRENYYRSSNNQAESQFSSLRIDLNDVFDESMQEAIRGAPAYMFERYRNGVKRLLKRIKHRAAHKKKVWDMQASSRSDSNRR